MSRKLSDEERIRRGTEGAKISVYISAGLHQALQKIQADFQRELGFRPSLTQVMQMLVGRYKP